MRWNSRNKKYYEERGYIYTAMKDGFCCKTSDLPNSSNVNVVVRCDYCGCVFEKPWYRYIRELGPSETTSCGKCRDEKAKANNMIAYGYERRNWTPEVREKRIATNLSRYGSSNPFSNEDIKKKIFNTNLERYGDGYATRSEAVKEKTRKTCLEKYGVASFLCLHIKYGPEHPCWKGGPVQGRTERASKEYIQWRTDVYKRDNYCCITCGSHAALNAHHLYNWKDYPKFRYDIDNGVTLCAKCHAEFHSRYGKKQNTPEQFTEFCQGKNVC